jgi:glycosyltransferase involved in cell wall biosynthesis
MKPSILFIVPTTYEALIKKGVENMIFERDEGGFFGKVITVHPFCPTTQSIVLNDCHEIYEVGFGLIPGSQRFRFLRYIQYPIHFLRIIWSALELVKKGRIDIIRAVDPYWMGLVAYICARLCKIPFCISIHADYKKIMELNKNMTICTVFGSYKLANLLTRFVLSKTPMVMSVTETLATRVISSGARKDKVRVIPHGIDLSSFKLPQTRDIHQQFGIDPSLKIVSAVARLSPEKYANDFLPIAKKLIKKRNDFFLVIAGGGKEEDKLKAEIASDELLKKHVLLVGFQPQSICYDLARASQASICLLSGFSLIEALAAGCPVVSYNVEWHSEVVKNNETGFLLKENDIDGVVDALDWLLENPAKRDAMGEKAKALAFERHELKNTSAIKVKWYSELLKQGENID